MAFGDVEPTVAWLRVALPVVCLAVGAPISIAAHRAQPGRRLTAATAALHLCVFATATLGLAQKLGLAIALLLGGKPNALIYAKEARVPMRGAFKDTCAPLFKLKLQPGAPRVVKQVLNSLWGGLSEKTKVREVVKVLSAGSDVDGGIEHLLSADPNEPSVPGEHNNHELLLIEPMKGGKYNVQLRDYRKPFKRDWARLGPF